MPQQRVTILIGPPGCGKSTYVKDNQHLFDFVLSSDNVVMKLCKENNISYREFFELATSHTIRKAHQQKFQYSIKRSKQYQRVVWDLTNLTKKDRDKIKSYYPTAEFEYIEFDWKNDIEALFAINKQRSLSGEKYIPEQVLEQMIARYEAP